jgi:hypothetical protein
MLSFVIFLGKSAKCTAGRSEKALLEIPRDVRRPGSGTFEWTL